MQLQSLVGPEIVAPAVGGAAEIAGLTADSRQVRPGWLFAAMPGAKADGARFIPEALAKGAAAVLVKQGTNVAVPPGVTVLAAAEPRRALALMAARFYAAQPRPIVAVTGTSGKTSVADFTRQIFAALGHKAASLGTIGLVKPDGGVYGALTTPDPVSLHETLAELAGEGVTHLAFEASSHGLDQHRLDGVRLKAAAFTNLGRDHLDYHPTMEAYLAAKLRLFSELLPRGRDRRRQRRRRGRRPGRRRVRASRPARPHGRHERATLKLLPPSATASRSACAWRTTAASTTCAYRCSATTRPRTRWSPPALPSRPGNRPSACCRRWRL